MHLELLLWLRHEERVRMVGMGVWLGRLGNGKGKGEDAYFGEKVRCGWGKGKE